MAPPKIEIDAEILKRLAASGMTQLECAFALGCSQDTLQRRYLDDYREGVANLCASLRRKQVDLANKGNVTMLIWLGKNLLGQSDKLEATGKDGVPLFPAVDREELIGKLLGPRDTAPKPETVQ